MTLKQALYDMEKRAADLLTTMEIEENHGPMKAHLYEEMVDGTSQAGGITGALAGAGLGIAGSDLAQNLGTKRLSGRVDRAEADALLKNQLAMGALTDPSQLAQYGALANEAEAAEAVFRRHSDELARHSVMGKGLPGFGRRVGAGLVGTTALGLGLGETMKRYEHNRLNEMEGLGLDEMPIGSALAGAAGAVAGGVIGRSGRPLRMLGRTSNGLVGALAGAGVGTVGTDVGLHLADN